MENSNFRFIFQNFFIFIFIFASISRKSLKNRVKYFLLRFSWKLVYNLILGWRIRILGLFFKISSSSSSFLLRLVKNQSKIESKIFLFRFSWKLVYNLILGWRIQISGLFFKISSSSSSFLLRLVENQSKIDSKLFYSDFHEIGI